jgi:hypothetical protein
MTTEIMTPKEIDAATIDTMRKEGWHIETAETWFSEGSLARACFVSGLQAATPRWVPVEERLPEVSGVYMTWEANDGPLIGLTCFDADDETFASKHLPTHWMPLPAAPVTIEGNPV